MTASASSKSCVIALGVTPGVVTRGRRADAGGTVLPVVFPDERGCARTKPGKVTAKRIRVANATEILFFTENLMMLEIEAKT